MKGSAVVQFKGGPGSGHHSHAGRPGKVGGSVSGSGPRRAIDYAGKSKKPYIDEGPTGWKADKHSITRVDYDVAIPISLLRSERVDLVRTADVESPRTFEYRQELMESMRDEGQKVPIDVAVEMDGSITIIDGTHRIEAASLLGWSHIYGDVRYFGNSQRNGLITEDSSLRMKGGPGSGHIGHKGRIGRRGGSVSGATSPINKVTWSTQHIEKTENLTTWANAKRREFEESTKVPWSYYVSHGKAVFHPVWEPTKYQESPSDEVIALMRGIESLMTDKSGSGTFVTIHRQLPPSSLSDVMEASYRLVKNQQARPSIGRDGKAVGIEWSTVTVIKGSDKSGHRGHAGRPGKVGGSVPGSVAGISEAMLGMKYDNYAAATDKAAFLQQSAQSIARVLGMDTDIAVLSDGEFLTAIRSEGFAKGVNPRAVVAYYNRNANKITVRESAVVSDTSTNGYRVARLTLYHELGHAYDFSVANHTIGTAGKADVQIAEDYADQISSKLSMIYLHATGYTGLQIRPLTKYLSSGGDYEGFITKEKGAARDSNHTTTIIEEGDNLYVIRAKASATLVVKGGPGSGHRGHKGRIGKRGGSVPDTGGSVPSAGSTDMSVADRVSSLIVPGPASADDPMYAPSEDLKNMLGYMAEHAGITHKDLDGLEAILIEPPNGYVWSDDEESFVRERDPDFVAVGVYNPATRTIHLSPSGYSDFTLVHEIGHHVHFTQLGHKYPSIDVYNTKFGQNVLMLRARYNSGYSTIAENAGLRSYSFTDTMEFVADSFAVIRFGNEDQVTNLVDLWKNDVKRGDPRKILKELMVASATAAITLKGGPGSGHRGHKGRVGKRGGSVPGTGDTGSMSIADRMYNLCIDGTEEQKNEIASLAEMANITLDNLEGLNGISFDHPAGMRYDWAPDHNSFIYIDDYDRGYLIVGSYDVENKVIHIAPAGMTTNTLAHEVGHHVQFTQIGVDNPKFTARVAVMAGKYNDIVMFNLTARVAGLRSYSFSSALEFYADSFSVMKQGLENQKKFLVDLWKEGGLGDPSAIIKELMTTDTLD